MSTLLPNVPELGIVCPGRHGQTAGRHIGQVIQRTAQQRGGRLVLSEIVPDQGRGTLQHSGLEQGGEGEDGDPVDNQDKLKFNLKFLSL